MIKDIITEIIILALIALALYFAWKKWLEGGVSKAVAAYKEDVATIKEAASSPWTVVSDLFKSATPYISQDQFRKNIATIQSQLEGNRR